VQLDTITEMPVCRLLPNWGEIEEIAGEDFQRADCGAAGTEEAMRSAVARTRQYFAP
jgi:hypothetical protein